MEFRRSLLCADKSKFLEKAESLKNLLAASTDIIAPKVTFEHLIDNVVKEWHLEVEALSEIVSLVASTNPRSTRRSVDVYSKVSSILDKYRGKSTSETFGLLPAEISAGDSFADRNTLVVDLHKLVEYISSLHRNYPQDKSVKTIPLVLDTIISAIRLSGKEIFDRKSRRESESRALLNSSAASAQVATPRAVQVVASAESEPAAAAAPDAAPSAQRPLPSFLGESQVVNALHVLHQIQNFLSIRPNQRFPTVIFVFRDDLDAQFFRQFAKALVKALEILRSFRSLYTESPQGADLVNCTNKLSSLLPIYVSARPSRPGIYLITNHSAQISDCHNIVNLVQLDRCVREAQKSHPNQPNIRNTEEFLYRLLQLWSFSANPVENLGSGTDSETLREARPNVEELTRTFRENSEILRALDNIENFYELPNSSSESANSDLINFEMSDPFDFPAPPTNDELAALETQDARTFGLNFRRSGVAPLESLPSRFERGRPEMNDSTYKPRLPLPLFRQAVHTRDFLSQFEDRMDMYRCNDAEKVAYLEESVRNSEADPWLRRYLLERGRRCNWNMLVAEFANAFTSPYDSEEARNAMENRVMRPGEAVRTYLYDKLDLLVRCDPNMSELDQIRFIKRGLPREYQIKLVGFQFDKVQDLKSFLVNLEGEINTLTRLNILPSLDKVEGPRVTINEGQGTVSALRPDREYFQEFASSLINAVKNMSISDGRKYGDSSRAPTPYRRDLSGSRSPRYDDRSNYRSGSRERIRNDSRGRYRDQSRDRDRNDRSRKQFRDQSWGRYRDQSRDRYRDQSRDRYREQSKDRYRDQPRDRYRGQSGNRSGYRSESRDRRDFSKERYRDHSEERRRSSFGKDERDQAKSKNGRA